MERDEKIIEMYEAGIPANTIYKNLKIGKKTVYRVLNKNGVTLQKDIKKNCLICNKECDKNICGTCNTNLRRYRVKKLAVEYLGNKCERCGWQGDLSGYDFHHKDPSKKDFTPSAVELANKSWDRVKTELDKCELLCALCHRLEHSSYKKLEEVSFVYNGKLFKQCDRSSNVEH